MLVAGSAQPISGQFSPEPVRDGSPAAAVAGGALGLVAGTVLGTVGSLTPCSQTSAGPRCVRWIAVTGGALGLVAGAAIEADSRDEVYDRLYGSAIGLGVSTLVSIPLAASIFRFGWRDAAAVGLLGVAVGAAPEGALAGLAIGSVIGLVAWRAFDSQQVPDMIAAGLGGMAIGRSSI